MNETQYNAIAVALFQGMTQARTAAEYDSFNSAIDALTAFYAKVSA